MRVRTPALLQMETTECGAAALGIILGYHGRYVPLEQLRVDAGVSRDGSKAGNMLRAASKYGLVGKAFSIKDVEDLYHTTLPVILFWGFNHFLVLEGFDKKYFYLSDPASGHRKVSHREFDEKYTGVVLTFEKSPGFTKGGHAPGLAGGLWKRLASSKVPLAYVLLAGLFLIVPGLIIPAFSSKFVDDVLISGLDAWVMPLLYGMLATVVVQIILTWLQRQYLLRVETRIAISESSKFVRHVLRLPLEFFAQRYAGDISSRIQSNDTVASAISGNLVMAFLNLVLLVFYLCMMLYYDPLLTVVATFIVALNTTIMLLGFRRMAEVNMLQLTEKGRLAGYAVNGLYNVETVKSMGEEQDFFAVWSGHLAKVKDVQQKLNLYSQRLGVVDPVLTFLSTAAILGIGSLRIMDGNLTVGTLVAFQFLNASLMMPASQLMALSSQIQMVRGDMARLDDVLEYPAEQATPQVAMGAGKIKTDGYVDLRNIAFGYSRLEPPLIDSFDLSLKPGSRVALVGKSGSGKSTISRLVMGLYPPWRGEVLFDRLRRQEISAPILNNSLSLVDQDIFLFQGTVRDNLTMWNPVVPDADVIRAAEDACIHDVIAARPGGYESMVAENGENFSGGERQRLEIARALVNNPSVLVLDEATSALDAVTEKNIDDNLRKRGCTCIIVAHRLSTIRDCDEIIVLDRGKVIQRGTHEELRSTEGAYRQLFSADRILEGHLPRDLQG
jgi:NHLM bacteriocin system ABC transporter peptidase/ATP-binding protein